MQGVVSVFMNRVSQVIHQAQPDVGVSGPLTVSAQMIRSGSTDFTGLPTSTWPCSRPRRTLTSLALGSQLAAAGWQLTKRCRKQDKVSALLHLEGFSTLPDILADLGLEKLVPVAAASEYIVYTPTE